DQAAAATFNRVAEAYTEQGFFLKAIAVYKQMMKLAPDDVRVNERLAGLYQQLGIMIDAMGQLQLVAQAAERAGDNAKLLEVLRRMTELEPENVGSAVKLGEIHARAGQTAEALVEFRRAADLLKRNNRADEYLRVAERISFLAPGDVELTRELANIYLAKGDTKRALAKLQLCFKADSKDVATLNLLAQAFHDLGQTSKTVSVWKELAHVQAERGRVEESRATWRKVLELSPDDPDAAAGLSEAAQAPSLTPVFTPAAVPAPAVRAPAPAGRPPAVIAPPPPSMTPPPAAPPAARPAAGAARPLGPEAIPKLLTETDVYVKYGLHQKALDHLRKVFEIDPGHLDAREKARDIRRAAGDTAGAADEGARAVRLALDLGLSDRAQAAAASLRELSPGHPDLAALEAGAGPAPPRRTTPAPGPPPAELLVESAGAEEPDDVALEAAGAAEDEVVEDDEAALAGAAGLSEDSAAVVGDEPLEPPQPEHVAPPPVVAPPPGPPLPPPIAAAGRPTPPPVAPFRLTPPPGPPPRLTPPPAPAPRPAPPPAPAARLTPPPGPPPRLTPTPGRPPEALVPPPPDAGVELGEEIEEAEFFAQQGLFADAAEVLRGLLRLHPGHAAAQAKLDDVERRRAARAPAATEPRAPPAPAVDIGRELAEELGPAAPSPGEEFQYSVEEVFSQFKKGVARSVKAEDADTHYDLGIAYKEMGLAADALAEFDTALRGATGRKAIDCLSMIGLCRMEQGDAGGAAAAWARALRSEHLTPEAARALQYDLARAAEAQGDVETALWYLQKVVQADPRFRDASRMLARLGGGAGRPPPEPAAVPPAPEPPGGSRAGSKKNIGYV
ncbi:MAG TPA: tetratricopeptide repeat protein, partial [Anaeromyxobacteraceae bacterium]